MTEPIESSTDCAEELVYQSEHETVLLDSRLALYGKTEQWLALSDLHYGYEVTRRAKGSLWPMWGRGEIESRLDELLNDHQPQILILNGDIIDSAAAGSRGAEEWLRSLEKKCHELVLIQGNHDRGNLVEQFGFRSHHQIGDFVFHHGHLPFDSKGNHQIEVIGHIHPSMRFRDGAGLSIKLPALVQESNRWIMPAFSPWAGGVPYHGESEVIQWACSPRRIIRMSG